MKVFGYIFMAVALYLFLMAWQNVAKQDQVIRPTVAINVVVLDKRVKETKSGDSPSYAPSIVFSYTIGKNVYHSDRVLPIDQTRGDKQRAENIINGYTVGKTYTGYYNPQDYSKSFLLRRYTIAFYLPLFFYLAMFTLGALFVCSPFKRTMPVLKPHPGLAGWYEIEPEANLAAQILALKVCLGTWWFGSFVILGSYALVAQPYLSIWFWVAAAIAVAIGIYPASQLFKLSQAENSISNILVLTDVARVVSGQGHKLKVIVKSSRESIVKALKLSLLCRQRISDTDGAQTSPVYEKVITAIEQSTNVSPGVPLTLDQILCAPAAYPKTGEDSSKKIEWSVGVDLSTDDGGELTQRYPFIVYP